MRHSERYLLTLTLILLIFTVSCSGFLPTTKAPVLTAINPEPNLLQGTPIVEEPVLFTADGIPTDWLRSIEELPDITLTDNREDANLVFESRIGKIDDSAIFSATRVYTVVVPFFTVRDEVLSDSLQAIWSGKQVEGQHKFLVVAEETRRVLTDVWGEPGTTVKATSPEGMLTYCEENPETMAIIPFEALTPGWKVLKINGYSPLDKPLDEEKYALTIRFNLLSTITDTWLTGSVVEQFTNALPLTNRDETKMTVLIMTGTTAITRVLAYKISIKGMDYPIGAVKDWFQNADIKHVSNESPFVEGCPVRDEFDTRLVFCTPPDMIEVLDLLGINVIEMTGNHINDYGLENLESTLNLYKEKGWTVFAAGFSAEEARSPALVENNGNKVAFIGCNAVGPATVFAREDRPGGAACDFDYLTQEIRELKQLGYVVVTTFQHVETENLMYTDEISKNFKAMAVAGADIVQGSQAHSPMGFEFVGDNLIHYGLGNFLFDQMVEMNRPEFIDRHIIYDGDYINTELLTALLVDWSRPTPMDEEDRVQLLEDVFKESLKRKNEN